MRDEQDLQYVMDQYADTVTRICVLYLKSKSDTDDIFQNVFLKYWNSHAQFDSEEHRKAWIIRVTINQCKDLLKSFFRKNTVSMDSIGDCLEAPKEESTYVREAVLALPEKYRTVLYLHYFEGYGATEIAQILGKNVNTIYTLLSRGREQLKQRLEADGYGI